MPILTSMWKLYLTGSLKLGLLPYTISEIKARARIVLGPTPFIPSRDSKSFGKSHPCLRQWKAPVPFQVPWYPPSAPTGSYSHTAWMPVKSQYTAPRLKPEWIGKSFGHFLRTILTHNGSGNLPYKAFHSLEKPRRSLAPREGADVQYLSSSFFIVVVEIPWKLWFLSKEDHQGCYTTGFLKRTIQCVIIKRLFSLGRGLK